MTKVWFYSSWGFLTQAVVAFCVANPTTCGIGRIWSPFTQKRSGSNAQQESATREWHAQMDVDRVSKLPNIGCACVVIQTGTWWMFCFGGGLRIVEISQISQALPNKDLCSASMLADDQSWQSLIAGLGQVNLLQAKTVIVTIWQLDYIGWWLLMVIANNNCNCITSGNY